MDSLNDIRLNNTLMVGLYANSLVEISRGVSAKKEISYLGNNIRNVTILVHDTSHTFLPEDHLSFLTKILSACKLNIGDVAIVNTNNNPDTKEIIDSLQPSKMILFGVELSPKNIETVSATSIKDLTGETAEAKALKSKLWSGLKQMFEV